jgi:hypothetical protein
MLGFAVVDHRPDDDETVVWLTTRTGSQQVGHTNAVCVNLKLDSEALKKIHSLTRDRAVVLTEGSTTDSLPLTSRALSVQDIDRLVEETIEQQARILAAVKDYAKKTRSKTVMPPEFAPAPRRADFAVLQDTVTQRALQTANFLARAWVAWLATDEQRRRRAVNPRSEETTWIMPEEMSSPVIADFPPRFNERAQPEPIVAFDAELYRN